MTSSREVELLLLSAGGSRADERIRQLSAQLIDWGRFLELSRREGAHPPLRGRLQRAGAAIPPEVDEVLASFERRTELRMTYLERRLHDVLGLLAREGIPVMLLKGAALAVTRHGSFAQRPMSDLDLLIAPAHATRAQQQLRQEGWRQRYSGELDELYSEMHHQPPLEDEAAPHMMIGLEVHTEIIPPAHNPFALSARDLWRSSTRIDTVPGQVSVPTAPYLLLHCCVHFAWLHACTTSAWRTFRDVSVIASGSDFGWPEFIDLAIASRAQSACFWSLQLARRSALIEIPDDVLEALRPPGSRTLVAMLETHFLQELLTPGEGCPSSKLRRALWSVAMRPRAHGHGRHRPWHAGDEHDWQQLGRADKAAFAGRRGSRLRQLSNAIGYVIGLRRHAGSRDAGAPRANSPI